MAKSKARRYQKKGIRIIESHNVRALLADDMGLGKTFQSLKVFQRNRSQLSPCIVVCPAPLKWNWAEEAHKHIGVEAEILNGTKPPRATNRLRTPDLVIVNYRILGHWLRYLRSKHNFPACVILDEVHKIKSQKTQAYKNVKKLCKGVEHIIALSGTPLTTQPTELFATLNLLWPTEFKSFRQYANRYSNVHYTPFGRQYKGAKNLDELHDRLKQLGMVRRRKMDVLHELPARTVFINPIELNSKQRTEYNKAKTDFLKWLQSKGNKRKANRARRAVQMVKIGYLRRLAAELKLDQTKDWIDHYLQESSEKILIFGVHKAVLQPLHEKYKAQSILIDGSITGKARHQEIKVFSQSNQKRIAFCNIQAGGVGLNMQAARDVAFIELPWTPADLDQAISRAHRMGQTKGVNIHLLIAQNTIEEKLCRILQERQKILDNVLDGKPNEDLQMDLFDRLALEIKKG